MSHQQHFLTRIDGYRTLLSTLPLQGRRVIEFGVGNGELTDLILEQQPAEVIGYELDGALRTPSHPALTVHHADFTAADLSWMVPGDVVISNPPYSALDFILRHIEEVGITDVVLMLPEARRGALRGGVEALVLAGDSFSPPSRGEHIVVVRWLR
jgi:16S rRNA A1518/A1519 N6-dimethyltransferase RsmA/KsgA/DIM1 with predicted DNA glycosylase/AP lyase activity